MNSDFARMLRALTPAEGANPTPVSYLTAYRFTTVSIKMPEMETPYLYLIADGSMRLHTPSGIMETIMRSDEKVADSAARLLSILKEPEQMVFMGKHMKREIIFHALCGSCGREFLQSILSIQQAGEIYEANTWIKENYKRAFTVEELVEQWNMSVSSFHQKFRSAVGMGPLQCQKRLRLTEARRRMLDDNLNVTDASFDVGYESVSQFIRDYRKMFHASPKEDIQNLRKALKPKARSC